MGIKEDTLAGLIEDVSTPVRLICLPAEVSEMVQPPELKDYYIDGLLDPVRLPKKILQAKLKDLGAFGFAGQYEQRPVPLSGGMFHWQKVKISAPPIRFDAIIRFWDKAATKDGDGAFTAGVKMGRAAKNASDRDYWVLDVIRGRWDVFTREKIIKQTAAIDGKSVRIGMEQEPGSGGKESALATIRNLAGYRVFAERATGDKCDRAEPFAGQVNGNNVGMAIGAWNKDYLQEMQHFGDLAKWKDQIDASSGCFNYLSNKKKPAGGAGF